MAKIKIPAAKPVGLQHIEIVLMEKGIKFVSEHQFLKDRKFRFDLAIPEKKIAIEYEGLEGKKTGSKSGHTTKVGYTKDCTKYNLAQIHVWKVLRYTALNYQDFTKEISILIF